MVKEVFGINEFKESDDCNELFNDNNLDKFIITKWSLLDHFQSGYDIIDGMFNEEFKEEELNEYGDYLKSVFDKEIKGVVFSEDFDVVIDSVNISKRKNEEDIVVAIFISNASKAITKLRAAFLGLLEKHNNNKSAVINDIEKNIVLGFYEYIFIDLIPIIKNAIKERGENSRISNIFNIREKINKDTSSELNKYKI